MAFSHRIKKTLGRQLVSVFLFGSKARGNSHRDSDTDIYILVKRKRANTSKKIAAATAAILHDHDILLSPVCYDLYEEKENSRLKSFFLEAVKKEGIPL
jgi:predicted nucleotidyltransferase